MTDQSTPLAHKIRPRSLSDYIGQSHLVGPNKPIRKSIETGNIHSMIFWGPPGSGKTTLARVIAAEIDATFHELSAVSAGKADIKKIIELSRSSTAPQQQELNLKPQTLYIPKKSILFLDEIHRFNKAQQDFLLPYVEDGTLILIGATTENPSFEVISALLSRSQVYVLNPLNSEELDQILNTALSFWSKQSAAIESISLSPEARSFLLEYSNGDARTLLNVLENTVALYSSSYDKSGSGGVKNKQPKPRDRVAPSADPGVDYQITLDDLKNTLQSKHLRYDTKGEEHYNTISAFIKSMRASDPNAALYYLARMVEAGENPKFIARRMVIFASEDIGMAQPTALVVANEVFRSVEIIGYPECAINLAHGVVYLATAKKDRRAYDGLRQAQADVAKHGNLEIPLELRNAPTKLMKEIGYGKDYEAYPDKEKSLLPEKLKGKKYYD